MARRSILALLGFLMLAGPAAQAAIAVTPEPFGGALNEAGPDFDFSFNASFSADGQRIYFSRDKGNWVKIAIFTATRQGEGWSMPVPVALDGNDARNTDPMPSADGALLYFSSDRPLPGQPTKEFDYHLWVAHKDGDHWSAPVPLGGAPDQALYPAVTNAEALYFMRIEGTSSVLYQAQLKDGVAVDVKPLVIGKPVEGSDEAVSRDGSVLAYVGTDAAGGRSIFLSRRGEAGWAAPEALALGDGFARPFALGLSPEGGTLYFTAKKGDAKIQMYSAVLPKAG